MGLAAREIGSGRAVPVVVANVQQRVGARIGRWMKAAHGPRVEVQDSAAGTGAGGGHRKDIRTQVGRILAVDEPTPVRVAHFAEVGGTTREAADGLSTQCGEDM